MPQIGEYTEKPKSETQSNIIDFKNHSFRAAVYEKQKNLQKQETERKIFADKETHRNLYTYLQNG